MAKQPNGLFTGTSEPDAVDAYMKRLKHPLRDTAQRLRTLILSVDKRVGEGVYWNAPAFYYTGGMKPFEPKTYRRFIVGFNFFKKDCIRLIFLRGATAPDPSGLLEGDYKDGRRLAIFNRLTEVKRREKDLKAIVKNLVRTIDDD